MLRLLVVLLGACCCWGATNARQPSPTVTIRTGCDPVPEGRHVVVDIVASNTPPLQGGGAWLELSVASDSASTAYHFDVPPTPHTAERTTTICASGEDAEALPAWVERCEVVAGDTHAQQHQQHQQHQQQAFRVSLSLPQGAHSLTARVRTTTKLSGVTAALAEARTSALVGRVPSPSDVARMRGIAATKHDERAQKEEDELRVWDRFREAREGKEGLQFGVDALDDRLRAGLGAWARHGDLNALLDVVTLEAPGVYSFPVFKPDTLRALLHELAAANNQTIPFTRPNTMNRYGLVATEVGLAGFVQGVIDEVVSPLSCVLFPEWGGCDLNHFHAFTIRYQEGEDLKLANHMDQSEVTLNVCLGDVFGGGHVFYHAQRDSPHPQPTAQVPSVPGRAVMHVGQHWHGATSVTSGVRHNIVVWARSDRFHQSPGEQFLQRCEDRHAAAHAEL